jgi:hypothetical protein
MTSQQVVLILQLVKLMMLGFIKLNKLLVFHISAAKNTMKESSKSTCDLWRMKQCRYGVSQSREANFDTGELSLTNITKERRHETTIKIWKR